MPKGTNVLAIEEPTMKDIVVNYLLRCSADIRGDGHKARLLGSVSACRN